MPDGAALLGEAPVVIGVESRMLLHPHLVVGDGVEVLDGEGTKTGIVMMIIGGYRHLDAIVTLRLPGVVDAAAGTVVTVEEAGEGRETQDLEVHHAGTPDMIERAVDTDRHTRRGGIMWNCT